MEAESVQPVIKQTSETTCSIEWKTGSTSSTGHPACCMRNPLRAHTFFARMSASLFRGEVASGFLEGGLDGYPVRWSGTETLKLRR